MQLAAATYGIGAAMADLYPNLSLTASGGTTSDALSDLLDTDSIVYNAVANLVGPIFSGGSRRAEVEAARARADAAAASYAGAVLNALREVEDALVAERMALTRMRLNDPDRAAELFAEATDGFRDLPDGPAPIVDGGAAPSFLGAREPLPPACPGFCSSRR